MRVSKTLLISFICLLVFPVWAEEWQGPSVNMKPGPLQVSREGTYLQHKDGTPFLYLADTAWELFHRLTDEEIEFYLEDRRSKGFTVIQAVLLPELDGLFTPNALGELPLKDIEHIEPNENYFKWVDKIIRLAETKGLYMALLPTWGDKVDKEWGKGPEIFTPAYAQAYGAWLGKRYKNFKNIIWINGGDRLGGGRNYPIWDALGKGLRSADKNHLITFHPSGEASSSDWFHNASWLDFNMLQTGHCQQSYEIYDKLLKKDYNRETKKPVLDGEPRYENHPICWLPDSLGWFDDTDTRMAMYWSLFSGACGHTYGCHDVWQMLAPGRTPEGHVRGEWKQALHLPGAKQVIHARKLLENFSWNERTPAQEVILSANESMEQKITALKGTDHLLVYMPRGGQMTLRLSGFSQGITTQWMNPRTGEISDAGIKEAGNEVEITAPSSGRGNDWVFIVREN